MGGTSATASSSAATTATSTEASSSRAGRSSPRTRGQQQRFCSVVEDQGVYSSTCGYCKASSRSSVAQGLWAYRLTVQDYQELLDRGWRRSGMFLYKPLMKKTCCPPHTIRLKAESFVATKGQMRVLRRMQRYLEGKLDGQTVGQLREELDPTSERAKGSPSDSYQASASDRQASNAKPLPADIQRGGKNDASERGVTGEDEVIGRLKAAIEAALKKCVECGSLPLLEIPTVSVKLVPQKVKGKLKSTQGDVDYASSISFAVMALLKRMGKKSESQGDEDTREQTSVFSEIKPDEIADMLVVKMSELRDANSFTVKACKGHINFILPARDISSSGPPAEGASVLPDRSEKKDKQPSSSVQSSAEPPAVVGTLDVRMKRSSFDAEEFALYKKYQVKVHNDRPKDVKEGSYRRFLVDTPLIFVPPGNDRSTPSCGFGSFHQQYRLDGKLVAVGVIDILPHCLSSKYLFWDPDFAFLSLGKYSSLQEIKWVQEAQKVYSPLQYYYLGFYIHSCPKMRYKGAYYPSELLCPESFSWVPYEVAVPFLDKQGYVCSSDIQSAAAELSIPGIASEQGTVTTSDPGSEEEESPMEVEADFSEFEDPEKGDTSFDLLLDKSVLQSANSSTGPLGNIQLYVNGGCISFKQLQELALVPQWHLDTLVHNLNRYLQVVGPSLASRMAYALS